MVSHVNLYGTRDERFEEIKADLEDDLGYEPTNFEVVGMLMATYSDRDHEQSPSAHDKRSPPVR